MTIHKEGYTIILITIILLIIVNLFVHFFIKQSDIVKYIIFACSVILLFFILCFFRSPHRKVIFNDNYIFAPADGKIVVIEEVEETEFFHDKRLQVSIFMSPLNVHVNWYPFSGKIKYFKYHPGKYLVAWHPKSSTKNERTTIVIEDKQQRRVLIRQIAGMVARRIVCYATEGDSVFQGEELGFIKFGSRVDLFLPLDAKINVQLNQKVSGKETVIAQFE